jgi:hypothetical protein
MKNKRVLELYSEALASRNAHDETIHYSPATKRRLQQARVRLYRIVQIIINRRIFGVTINEQGEAIANDVQAKSE